MFLDRHSVADDGRSGIPPAAAERSCATCLARVHSICAEISGESRAVLTPRGRRRWLARGQVFLWQDDRIDMVANVLGGIMGFVSTSADGSEQIVGLVGTGGFLGNDGHGRAAFSVVALTNVELCVFATSAFEQAAGGADLQQAMLRRASAELERSRHWMAKLGRASAMERVSSLLIEFQSACPDEALVPFALSRGQMADFAGLSIETVSRQLTQLRADGIIEIDRRSHFRILDPIGLRDLAQLPLHRCAGLH
jgi:CRP/FNR family transcriptional regulator